MGLRKLEVSDFGRDVNAAILAGMGVRRLSATSLAHQIGRSPTYVQERTRLEKEWALSDIARICDAWHISRDEFLLQTRVLKTMPQTSADSP